MKNIAFIFKSAPHGNSSGREGLDALLAISNLTRDIGVFFIGDGVFQILNGQQPNQILSRNYIATFGVLPLFDIKTLIMCSVSLKERGYTTSSVFLLKTKILSPEELYSQLEKYHIILTF